MSRQAWAGAGQVEVDDGNGDALGDPLGPVDEVVGRKVVVTDDLVAPRVGITIGPGQRALPHEVQRRIVVPAQQARGREQRRVSTPDGGRDAGGALDE